MKGCFDDIPHLDGSDDGQINERGLVHCSNLGPNSNLERNTRSFQQRIFPAPPGLVYRSQRTRMSVLKV